MDSELTILDIAKLAGVSTATVSRVLAGKVGDRSKVKRKVLEIIQETSFQPNAAAQSLASKRTGLIGLIFPVSASKVLASTYHIGIIESITHACIVNDYNMVLFMCESQEDEAKAVGKINHKGLLDGLIANVGCTNGSRLANLVSKVTIPVVTIGRHEILPNISFVEVDNFQASYNVVTHLTSLGRKRIAMITSPLNTTDGCDRVEGFRKALLSRGIEVDEKIIVEGDNSEKRAYFITKNLISQKIDAIFAAGDVMALGAIRAIREEGLTIPDDIAIVGFDDLPEGSMASPLLTTVRQPLRALGLKAVELLIHSIEQPFEKPQKIILDPELIIRQSCGMQMN
jgi:DNA-binding LacI/PurR family transcriptional regulator